MPNDHPWGKLYEKTFEGSMYGAGPVVFSVWCYAIAHMRPPNGAVKINPRALADTIGCQVGEVDAALDILCGPDPRSDSPAMGGRRLVKVGPFAYEGVNFAAYRAGRQPDERREQVRDAVARHRAKHVIQDVSHGKPQKAQAEAEADTEEKNTARKRAPAAPAVSVEILMADGLTADMANDWLHHRSRKKANLTPTAWNSIKAQARKAGYSVSQAVETAIRRGWTSFEAEWVEKDGVRPNGAAQETRKYLDELAAHKSERPPADVLEKIRGIGKR